MWIFYSVSSEYSVFVVGPVLVVICVSIVPYGLAFPCCVPSHLQRYVRGIGESVPMLAWQHQVLGRG